MRPSQSGPWAKIIARPWVRELFKSSNDSWGLCSLEWKNIFKISIRVLCPWDHDWGMFFGYFYDAIIRSHEPILWLEAFLDSRLEYESCEPLIEFLAFLVQKLSQKIQILQEFPKAFKGFPWLIFHHFCHDFSTRNARMSIKPFKDSYHSLESIQIQWSFAPGNWLLFLNSTGCWRHSLFWQTCQKILWLCKHGQKGRIRTGNFF